MVTACWSLKGGSGTTVVAAGLALSIQRRIGRPVLLVDLAGDLPAALGLPEPTGPGVAEWLAAGPAVPPDALARLEEPVAGGPGSVAEQLAAEASRSLLVTRPCYLAVRRLARAPLCPSGVVVVRDPGRALSDDDVARQAGAPVVGSVALDPAVARAVDCGLLVSRLPRGFAEVMRAVA